MVRTGKIFKILSLVIITACILYVLYSRFRLGQIRYLDSDELMYPNWASHVLMGYVPYRDFMLFVTPLFVFLLAPLFVLFQGPDPVTAARVLMSFLLVLNTLSVVLLFKQLHGRWTAILAGLIFLVIPMPNSDKLIEIRPDSLALFFFIWGLIFQTRSKKSPFSGFLSGVFYSFSFLSVQKFLPFIAVSVLLQLFSEADLPNIRSLKKLPSLKIAAGFFIPLCAFLLWSVFFNDIRIVLYSVFRLAYEQSLGIGRVNPLPWNFYFFPNQAYYGQWGYSPGYLLNLALWFSGAFWAFVKLLIVIRGRSENIRWHFISLLLYSSSILIYCFVTPLKFPQYLIFPAFITVIFVTEFLSSILIRLKIFAFPLAAGIAIVLAILDRGTNGVKFGWANSDYYRWMGTIFSTVPRNEYFFDLNGLSLYYPYPYYMCCMSIGNFQPFVSMKLPALRSELERTRTKYIFEPSTRGQYTLLPEDQKFIRENYRLMDNGFILRSVNW